MRYSIQEVFSMLGKDSLLIDEIQGCRESIEVEGFKVYKKSMRYATFYQKGCKCVVCGKEGTYFQLDADREGASIDTRRHFNLYAEDGTLMTKDHILPKRWGGKDHISNFQTMCKHCNEEKGSQCDIEVDGILAVKTDNSSVEKKYSDIEKAIYDVCNDTHVFSQGGKPSTVARKSIHVAIKILNALEEGTPAYGYYWSNRKIKFDGKSYEN